MLDENNLFNDKIKTEDIYIDDNLFDDNDKKAKRKVSDSMIEDINLNDDVLFVDLATDAPQKVKKSFRPK